jgi:fatty acid synthase
MLNFVFTDHTDIPVRTGKLHNIDKFDASFFSVHYKQAQSMDPQSRMLLEKTYEAIVDAGSSCTCYGVSNL